MGQCTPGGQEDDEIGRSTLKPKLREHPNLDFYKDQYPIVFHQTIVFQLKHWMNLTQQHQITKFYQDLETDKQYMQWLFPSFFQSFFNINSSRLTIEERNLMIADQTIMQKYKQNAFMFMRYMGIENKDGKLEICDEKQLEYCLFGYTQNMQRAQRLLASLSVMGQRQLALQFLEVLEQKLGSQNKTYVQKFSGFEKIEKEGGQLIFSEVKQNYVQQDIVEEEWVTDIILSDQPITIKKL